tara:strand:+ start:4578 stop:4976 length:399 start_codon:yes stop_codon:yes gene_type:complete
MAYKPPKTDKLRKLTPKEKKDLKKREQEKKKIEKHHGKTTNELVREDASKIRQGKRTGRRLFGSDDGTKGNIDANVSLDFDRKKMKRRSESGGKGDAPRNCFSEEFRENYDKIFGKKKIENRKGGKTIRKYK